MLRVERASVKQRRLICTYPQEKQHRFKNLDILELGYPWRDLVAASADMQQPKKDYVLKSTIFFLQMTT